MIDRAAAGDGKPMSAGENFKDSLAQLRVPADLVARSVGLFWFVLAVVSALPLFWLGLTGLATEWARPEFSHGPVIPVLSFYLFLREMKFVPPATAPVTDRNVGVALIALSLAMAAFGNLVRIDDIVFYALIVWVGGLILTGFGFARGWVFWPSVLHLVFMLPLPQFLYWKLNIALQLVSSEVGVSLVRLAGVPVFLDGNVIDLGVYKLQVAEACSGLRYLFPIMSFSYVFAVLYRGPVWHKIVLLLAAAPLAVLMNSVRIGVIGVLVDRYGIGQAEGFLHFFEGWIIFLTCIAILFAMAVAMQRLSGDRRRLGEAIDLDFSRLGAQLRRVLTIAPSAGMTAAALITAAASLAWVITPARPTVEIARDSFTLFPRSIGGWAGSTSYLDPQVERVLKADDYISAYFSNPAEAQPVDFFVAYYENQTQGAGIHSPEVCLPTGGWEIFSLAPTEITLEGTRFGTFEVNRAVIQQGLDKQLVYYWFEGRGRRETNDFAAKFHTVADSMSRGRTDGALVRVITPIGADGEAAADARLQRFLAGTVDRLDRFVPE